MAKTYRIKDGQEDIDDKDKIIIKTEEVDSEFTIDRLQNELDRLNSQVGNLAMKRDTLEDFIAEIRQSVGI